MKTNVRIWEQPLNKAFTLIELLAVIVILAIISLIATPIILDIINDAKEESDKRSIDMYGNAVENAIAKYQLTNSLSPTTIEELTVEYEGNKVECETNEIYDDGSIYLDKCKVNGEKVEYAYGKQQEVLVNLNDICTPVSVATTGKIPTGNYDIGDEYTCEVKKGTSYTFFVLSKEENKVNLIMDSNINKLGEAVKSSDISDKGLVSWISNEDYIEYGGTKEEYGSLGNNNKGPITAMKYLELATKDWNTGKIITSKFDDESGQIHDMIITMSTKARMPKYSEVTLVGCKEYTSGSCPLWMVNYLNSYISEYPNRTTISEIYGYWTFSSNSSNSIYVFDINYYGYIYNVSVNTSEGSGIRPVITLSI